MRRFISFKEDAEIIETMDEFAKKQGSDRSAFIRGAIRNEIQRARRAQNEQNGN